MQSISVSNSHSGPGGIVPALRYKDVRAATSWLCSTFGFEQQRLVEDADGSIRYVQLSCGAGMVMLCPIGASEFDTYMVQPDEIDHRETQACYVFVPDVLAHKSRAMEAGAELVLDIDAGGRGQGYSCRDPEGHIWSFGSYDPWGSIPARPLPEVGHSRARLATMVAAAGIVAAVTASVLTSWLSADTGFQASLAQIEDVLEKPADLAAAERLLHQARTDLARERALRMQAERAGRDASARTGTSARLAKRTRIEDEDVETAAADRPIREASVRDSRREVVQFPTGKSAMQPNRPLEVSALPVRAAASPAPGREEIDRLRRAVALAQAQLKEENERHASGRETLRNQLERERAARESAERVAQDARARVARIEALRRAEYERRNALGGYRDISSEVFSLRR